jgi:phosphatidylglycerophosphatase A
MSSSKTRLAELLATWFGLGYAPFAPGTFGSLGALLPAAAAAHYLHWPAWVFGAIAVGIMPLAIWASNVTALAKDRKDPGLVVIDEVVGQWITIAGMTACTWTGWILAFVLFRIFDIVKPWPARQLESLSGGTGIVMDDVMAGVYGALVLHGLGWFNLI